MPSKFRIPGIQVPSKVDPETRAFMDAVKERLELQEGERGDNSARSVRASELSAVRETVRQVQATTTTTTRTESLDFTSYPEVQINAIDVNASFLIQGVTVSSRYRLPVNSLFSIFARTDQETELQVPWAFSADDYGYDIRGIAPRFRFVEQPAEDDVETSLPSDSAIWDYVADAGVMRVRLWNDDEDTAVDVILYGRTGMNPDYVNVVADALEHNGEQVITQPGHGLDKSGDTLDVDETELDHNTLDNLAVGDPHPQYGLRRVPITHQTADYTATVDDSTITVDATAGPVTIALPAIATSLGVKLTIKKVDNSANIVTVDPDGAETIDTVASLAIVTQNGVIRVHAGATQWHRV